MNLPSQLTVEPDYLVALPHQGGVSMFPLPASLVRAIYDRCAADIYLSAAFRSRPRKTPTHTLN